MKTKLIYVFATAFAVMFSLTSCKGQGEKKESSSVSVTTEVAADNSAKRPVMTFEKKDRMQMKL